MVGFIAQFLYEQQPVKIAIDEDVESGRLCPSLGASALVATTHVSRTRCALDGPLEPAPPRYITTRTTLFPVPRSSSRAQTRPHQPALCFAARSHPPARFAETHDLLARLHPVQLPPALTLMCVFPQLRASLSAALV